MWEVGKDPFVFGFRPMFFGGGEMLVSGRVFANVLLLTTGYKECHKGFWIILVLYRDYNQPLQESL